MACASSERSATKGCRSSGEWARSTGSTNSATDGCGSYQNQRKMMTTLKYPLAISCAKRSDDVHS
eukprot:scaffold239626_cov36-Tisochrysis_lutea.AAC.3